MGSMGHGGMGGSGALKAADRPTRGTGKAVSADLTKSRPKPKLAKGLPGVWKLILPRKWLIAGSFLLMIVNRICSLVLPISSRPFINDVMKGGNMHKLP